MSGNEQLNALIDFAEYVDRQINTHRVEDEVFDGQPSGKDLDACDSYIRELQSVYATLVEKAGQSEALFNRCVLHCVQDQKDEDNFKKVKNSSTLTTAYVAGKYPSVYELMIRMNGQKRVIHSIFENYRTLLSSYRMERQLQASTVRQQ